MLDLTTTMREFLTPGECAIALARARRTIYYWIAQGKIDAEFTPMGLRIPISEARRIAGYLAHPDTPQHVMHRHPTLERAARATRSVQASANSR